jgi:hypothetical protein
MNGSKLSRLFAPTVTIISLAAWLARPAYAASRPRRKVKYVPRHARPRKVIAAAGAGR